MEPHDLVAALTPLAVAFRTPMDGAQWRVYFVALQDVPIRLVHEAVTACIREDRAFMPKPGEVRKAAERARLQLLAAVPYVPCDECGGTGWRALPDGNRVERCSCKQRHLDHLSGLGLGPPLVRQLGAASDDGDHT